MGNGTGNRKIVIVEDTESCAATLEIAFLSIPDVTVVAVSSARQALEILHNGPVSALVTDLHMPRMDGFELIRIVRADSRFSGLPVIVVSGDIDPRTPERVSRMGVNAFFSKPYSPAEVREKLEHLLDVNTTPEAT
jgi:two-component system, chemotaxis family, chemotaxis protein CheY